MNFRAASLVTAAVLLSACASAIDVRSVGAVGAPPAYELRGKTLAELDVQAKQLCPAGHEDYARWQRRQGGGAKEPNPLRRGWLTAGQLAGVLPDDEAQLTIRCTG